MAYDRDQQIKFLDAYLAGGGITEIELQFYRAAAVGDSDKIAAPKVSTFMTGLNFCENVDEWPADSGLRKQRLRNTTAMLVTSEELIR